MEIIFDGKAIQDSHLDYNSGRIVIYEDQAISSRGNGQDHNDLLRALARRYGFPAQDVISNAIRLYYKKTDDKLIVSERRKIDYDMMERNLNYYSKIILSSLKA